ncbi:MAG: stage V sporulation protein AD [Clostridia bacterium]|nr:stage V sporulation protein AD [Clostridia bacterium]
MHRTPIPLNAVLRAAASAVGRKEKEGPLGHLFDLRDPTDRFGAKTWEGAESEMQRQALNLALAKLDWTDQDPQALFAGDLLNQCVGSAYGLLSFDIPYFGLYGACSTCAEGLLLASIAITGGAFSKCATVTSSHYCAAERQYRTPIEYGAQRAPTAQWTVTGAGAFLLTDGKDGAPRGVRVVRGLPGKAMEAGINDANNMGAAMAPAALDTLLRFFRATQTRPEDYDRIVTGDLGFEGGAILSDLMLAQGLPMGDRYTDCGQLIYHRKSQDVHGGGSGCGCSAVVLASHLLPQLERGELKRILFLSTGAMMSPDSLKQGENIPAVAHLLELEAPHSSL